MAPPTKRERVPFCAGWVRECATGRPGPDARCQMPPAIGHRPIDAPRTLQDRPTVPYPHRDPCRLSTCPQGARMSPATVPVTLAGRELAPPRHVCCFFDSTAQQYEVLIPYLREGLDHQEK